MAKISASKKIIIEDYQPEYRDLIQRLSFIINPFLDQAVTAVNQQITYRDNLKSKIYQFSLDAGVSTIPLAWDLNERPTAVYIGNLLKSDNTPPSSPFSLSWYYAEGKVRLTFIGLNAANKHLITVIGQC